jgi:hypothetical protein
VIVTALTDAFRLAQLDDGAHRRAHEYRMALYTEGADLGPHTAAYSPDGEVVGEGYVAGGLVLRGRRVQLLDGIVVVDFVAPVWDPATISARGFLLFNGSLPGFPSVMTGDFGRVVTSTNGPFTPVLPSPGPHTSLIRWR